MARHVERVGLPCAAAALAIALMAAPAVAQESDPDGAMPVDTLEDNPDTDAAFAEAEASEQEAEGTAGGGGGDADDDPFADDPPAERSRPITVGLLAGYGFSLNASDTFDLNPFGFGFGVRGGYDLGGFYAGGRFQFFLGESEAQQGAVEISYSQFLLALEVGFATEYRGLTMRPSAALGVAVSTIESNAASTSTSVATEDPSSEDIFIAPGLTLLYPLQRNLHVGGEAQLPIIFADRDTVLGLTLMATGEMAF